MDENNISASLNKLRNIDLNLLTVFEAVYLHKGIVNAAKALNLTPSSISQSIQKLRNTFPDPLFIRSGKGITPTAYAKNLHNHISEGLGAIITGLDFSQDIHKTRFITVSCRPHTGCEVLPRIYQELIRVNPNYVLKHQDIPDNYDALNQFNADIVIDAKAIYSKSIVGVKIFAEKIVCVCHRHHPRITDYLSLENAVHEKFTFLEINDLVLKLQKQSLDLNEFNRNFAFTTYSSLNMLNIVAGSDLVCFVTESMYEMYKRAYPIKKVQSEFSFNDLDIYLYYNRASKKDKTLMQLINTIIATFSGDNITYLEPPSEATL
ncbi:LysR family transcriptional regulator [Chimaeribacter californicus]|uniref:LysR family transcriptional regulator n=1 Tax=Chimaeribacter californicus TaxID=2060067 RepID=A0A2N5EA59_9GAMM|nr:YbeF family transcriptional regulator [Chimaeribacter californicus]PLR38777.1 LysR family transcriptional regulator [Chimaeribacter californicus]